MSCHRWRDAISALADGEAALLDEDLVAAHLRRCPECHAYQQFVTDTRRLARIAPAPQMPDLAPRVVKLHSLAARLTRWTFARVALAVVAVEVLILSLPNLVLGDEADASVHGARHLGAFSVAYGAALVVVVIRPGRARTVLPVAVVLAATLLITAIIDVADGHVPLVGETQHIPEILSVLLVWLLARPTPTRDATRTAPIYPRLKAVEDDRRTG